ncbi:unnamed protein product [Prorocentrum cordatum]|uniref:Uncharacterized protein n=1 Tax=Prorocentrum cordatum TaxID=2364126 RepID=A0ABN9PB87_9DINO|nr:unnamed protein product [Polarella glacialis]
MAMATMRLPPEASAPGEPPGPRVGSSLEATFGRPDSKEVPERPTATPVFWPSSCTEKRPYYYTSVEPFRPHSQSSNRGYHPKRGFQVTDHETICVPARDKVRRTRRGITRCSRGAEVVYAASQWTALELDAEDLLRIMRDLKLPANQRAWTLRRMDKTFADMTGRKGCWARVGLPFEAYLALFPRTFDVYGAAGSRCLRALHGAMARVADKGEDVMVRLALALRTGRVEVRPPFEQPPGRTAATVEAEALAAAERAASYLGDSGDQWPTDSGPFAATPGGGSSASGDAPRLPNLQGSLVKAIYRPSSAPCCPQAYRGDRTRPASGSSGAAGARGRRRPHSSPTRQAAPG